MEQKGRHLVDLAIHLEEEVLKEEVPLQIQAHLEEVGQHDKVAAAVAGTAAAVGQPGAGAVVVVAAVAAAAILEAFSVAARRPLPSLLSLAVVEGEASTSEEVWTKT